jgi:hypothetical protein
VHAQDDVEVNLLLAVWVFLLVLGMSAAVIGAYLLPPEETER